MGDAPPASDVYDRIRAKADEIEAELKRIGYWQAQPPKPEAFQFKRAFAADTMAFPQWLQFVFLPRARDVAARRDAVPDASNVGAYAVRELDGDPKADVLVGLLSEFDALFGTPTVFFGGRRGRLSGTTRALVWTVVAAGLGILFYGYAARLLPRERHNYDSYSATDPASGAYATIALSTHSQNVGGTWRGRELRLEIYPEHALLGAGVMGVDLTAGTYQSADADGTPHTGPFAADAVLAWMRRCGIKGDDAKLAPEAAALARFADAIRTNQAATFAARRAAPDAPPAGEPFRLAAISTWERPRPATLPLAAKIGIPAMVWLAGLGVIGLLGRRRGA